MKVEFRSSFARDLKRIRDQSAKRRIKAIIEQIEKVDTLRKISGVRKLSVSGNYYRIRIGDHRLGLLLKEDTVVTKLGTELIPRMRRGRNRYRET